MCLSRLCRETEATGGYGEMSRGRQNQGLNRNKDNLLFQEARQWRVILAHTHSLHSSGFVRPRSASELLQRQKAELPCLTTVCLRTTRHACESNTIFCATPDSHRTQCRSSESMQGQFISLRHEPVCGKGRLCPRDGK